MQVITDIFDWQRQRNQFTNGECGFVPTMGNLHEGHASLLRRCKTENNISILSIFVNPTQFNNQHDFVHYPKTRDQDLKLAEQCGVDFVLFPTEIQLYADHYSYRVHEMNLSEQLEGIHRPGHFSGVLTVVLKLLNLVRPARLYLGEKDYQQYRLVRDMIQAFFLAVDVVLCETIRLPSGLAYSSRNSRLNPQQLSLANEFASIFHSRQLSILEIEGLLKAKDVCIDYLVEWENRRFAAVSIGGVRLIDNYSC